MENVPLQEYQDHKAKCSLSFQEIIKNQEELKLAIFGNKEVQMIGMLDKVNEMHQVFMGSGFTFKTMLKFLSLLALIGTVLTFLYKLLTFKL